VSRKTSSAPRIDSRLVAALGRLDDAQRPIAETHRRLGFVADELGIPRPSYQCVRLLVHVMRRGSTGPGIGDVLLDFALRTRSVEAIFETLVDPPQRPL
jgi:hypothetical protein